MDAERIDQRVEQNPGAAQQHRKSQQPRRPSADAGEHGPGRKSDASTCARTRTRTRTRPVGLRGAHVLIIWFLCTPIRVSTTYEILGFVHACTTLYKYVTINASAPAMLASKFPL
jgi:hypothetical protein